MTYTPPASNAVNFIMKTGYVPPVSNAINFAMTLGVLITGSMGASLVNISSESFTGQLGTGGSVSSTVSSMTYSGSGKKGSQGTINTYLLGIIEDSLQGVVGTKSYIDAVISTSLDASGLLGIRGNLNLLIESLRLNCIGLEIFLPGKVLKVITSLDTGRSSILTYINDILISVESGASEVSIHSANGQIGSLVGISKTSIKVGTSNITTEEGLESIDIEVSPTKISIN